MWCTVYEKPKMGSVGSSASNDGAWLLFMFAFWDSDSWCRKVWPLKSRSGHINGAKRTLDSLQVVLKRNCECGDAANAVYGDIWQSSVCSRFHATYRITEPISCTNDLSQPYYVCLTFQRQD